MRCGRFCFLVFLLVLLFCSEAKASVAEEWMEEMDFSQISDFLEKEEDMPVSFEEVIEMLLKGEEFPYQTIGDFIKDILLSGFTEHKRLFLSLLVVSLAFSILKNYARSFGGAYVSEICFFLCYCFMMALLLQSFSEMNAMVLNTTDTMVNFMKLLIPAYCVAISFTLNLNSSAAAYSVIFMAVYLVEWLVRFFLVPLVQIYVILEFSNHLMEEERFHRLSELIAEAVRLLLKAAVTFILGINIIQGMIAPAMDRLAGNSIAKTIQMVPGIGNVADGMGQIFISSGLVIKNCVGAAGLILLLLLLAAPFFKMAFLAALYKVLSAIIEPIADKRLSGGVNGIANGGMLYLKILTTCFMLFFLTVALTSAATGLGMGG